MNITFRTNASGSWQNIGNNESIYNGTYSQTPSNMDSYETTYFWSVNVSDGILWTNATYYFTTSSEPVPWWDEDWQYSKKITIDHTKVDDDLISGFLSAIFSLSKELSLDRIHVMDMRETKLVYEYVRI